MLTQATGTLRIKAAKAGLHEITSQISSWLDSRRIGTGLLTIFCRHTSASLLIQENAAPAARHDLERFFDGIAPQNPALYDHDDEGPDDMPAHIRTALTQTQICVPVENKRMMLGTWQGVFLFEHRQEPPERTLALHLIGEPQ